MQPEPRTTRPAHAIEIGPRVYLRYPQPRDCEGFVAIRRASRAHLEPWEPRPPRGFDAYGHDQFAWILKTRRQPDQERMFILELADRRLVGQVSLGAITRGPLQSAYMGYWIGVEAVGKGFMTEAVGLMLRHAFGRLGLHRVEANIQPHNQPSRVVAQRNGFQLEGFSPRYLQIAGVWADHERWAITIEDWRAATIRESGGGASRSSPARSRPST